MSIEVLLSTVGSKRSAIEWGRALNLPDDVGLLVIEQTSHDEPEIRESPNRRLMRFSERGLSRSRNRALAAAEGDLVLLADDDIRYVEGAFTRVREAFSEHPEADFFRFQMSCPGSRSRLSYPKKARWLRPRDLLGVASVEIAFRRRVSQVEHLRFDERFGLGAEFPGGEEALFLDQVMKQGGRGMSFPYVTVIHPGDSSGHKAWGPAVVRQKGAVLRRIFPMAWPVYLLALGALRRRHYRPGLGFVEFLRLGSDGAWALGRQEQKAR